MSMGNLTVLPHNLKSFNNGFMETMFYYNMLSVFAGNLTTQFKIKMYDFTFFMGIDKIEIYFQKLW